ncbi:MAG TPA: MBL fold metallo-hydrolase [Pirellulales bacterium]|nr:MBL fold metallo-hydrolase [Pirellulales bacterium]
MPLPSQPLTTDIRGQLVFLGTGTSVGVPIPGCDCATCRSAERHNQRTRCGLAVGLPRGNLLVDTPTDLRSQLLREQIGLVHAVLYTHDHADHLFGLDDLRVLSFYLGGKLPLYCEARVEERIRRSFDYAFTKDAESLHEGAVPQLRFARITTAPFELLGVRVVPIRLKHGRSDVLGFRFGNVAYCTDTNGIPDESWPLLEGLDVLILDALRHKSHPTHLSLDEAIAIARRLRPRRTLFTHMSHDLEHAATCAALPATMELAYDGLKIPLT